MELERKRVEDDLRGLIAGEVFCDELIAQLYATDGSIYQVRPLGVVRPKSAADVAAVAQYAQEHAISLHPRGAGSGVAGESLGRGLVIDFSRYMRRWFPIASQPTSVRVQAGLVLAALNRDLASSGRQFGPDPATRSVTTMGSVLSINATGSHYLRSGSARDTVESVEWVGPSGEILQLSQHRIDEPTYQGRLALGVYEILKAYEQPLREHGGRLALANGIRLDGLVDSQEQVNLAKLLIGSQGTLGMITEATVRTEPIAAHRGVGLLFFNRLDAAARGAVAAVQHGVVACDLMDRRLIEIARETEPAFAKILPSRDVEAMVLVEVQGEVVSTLQDRIKAIEWDLIRERKLASGSLSTVNREQRDLFWALSRRVVPRLYRVKGEQNPLPFVEDVRVPPEHLPQVLTDIQEVLQKQGITATIFAHAGHGHLHIRPFLDLSSDRDCQQLLPLSEEITNCVWKWGGVVGTEHAAGLSRSWLMERQYGELWPAIKKVKRLFDPQAIMNPGKLVGDWVHRADDNLRQVKTEIHVVHGDRELIEPGESELLVAEMSSNPVRKLSVIQDWGLSNHIEQAARSCNGCGRCRTTAPDQRQCPMFRVNPSEEASPRAKANLMRSVLAGAVDPNTLASDQAKEIADLCFGCHQCRIECPASVDVPKIVNEIKAQHVATNGLKLSDLLFSRIDQVASIGARFPRVANYLMRSPFWRWLAEQAFGLSRARTLPPIANQTFIRYAAKRHWGRPSRHGGTKVVYFVDHYVNYHETEIGKALSEILLHNQIGLYVPAGQASSGMARITAGDMKGALRVAKRNVRILAEAIRQGYTVIVTEPAAALALKHEYLNLMDDEDTHLVAKNTQEACRYLWDLHQQNRLSLDFKPVTAEIAYHQPCHIRAIDDGEPGPKLMSLIPGLSVQPVNRGCSGMAGTWGMHQKNYRNSLRIGWPLITAMRRATGNAAATECSACRLQIEHGSGRTTLHPLKLIAYAYGRLPKLEQELNVTRH